MDANAVIGPAWYCGLALAAVLGDAFLPFLPSGTLVILAVLKTGQMGGSPLLLAVGVAIASFLGDLLLLNLARRGAPAVHRRLERRPRLAASVERVQLALTGRTTSRAAAAIVIIARFVPAGRTVLDVAVGHSPNRPWTFLRWSAVAAVVWATYIVSLGWLNLHWFDTAWLSFAISCLAATAISSAVVQVVRRRRRLSVLVEGV
ncbi:DedA family protein [Streptomyces sp. TLI_171]|uniref:DedA family protein n=1 Tax=Streptomyces sp. TLI_171 TaxID=1938859 RepID=UPI000C17E49B|nr:VTT domain-containing protein [Streptomyces sp. TLI_171]RKE19203.1 membrane protein DedA with SNARE-associated domain [Streptomyces sp. TLI_171]